jgi:hypothetical protein
MAAGSLPRTFSTCSPTFFNTMVLAIILLIVLSCVVNSCVVQVVPWP